jgi:hypothetical protein
MFDQEKMLIQFLTQTTLARFNIYSQESGPKTTEKPMTQDLKLSSNDDDASSLFVESDDAVEIATLLTVWKDMKLDDVN